jgi:hypothetical protein
LDYTASFLLAAAMPGYTRLYADDDGESHFAEVEIDFTLTEYAPPAPPLDLSAVAKAKDFAFMNAPAGWLSDWHSSATRSLFVVLSGEWEVTASDGETRTFGVGSVLLAEDTTGKGHTSRVLGDADSLAAMLQLDETALLVD